MNNVVAEPEMSDVGAINKKAQPYEVSLVRIQVSEDELTSCRVANRFPTGVTVIHHTDSLERARHIMIVYPSQ